jgi:hypothetical protein
MRGEGTPVTMAHLYFWSLAFLLMAGMIACAGRGVLHARRGRLAAHRRAMLAAAGLLIAFLLSYVAKVVLLGREDLALWSPGEVALLRVHETFVALMLVCGATARWLARRFGRVAVPAAPSPSVSAGLAGLAESAASAGRAGLEGLAALAAQAGWAAPAVSAPAPPPAGRRALHRRLGRAAVVSGLFGLLTAGGLLATMVRHAAHAGAVALDRQHPALHALPPPGPPRQAVAALLPAR